jgi:serine/threonine protein kinase
MLSCPGEGTLRLLGADALGDGTYAAIEQHVEGCPECHAVLERLAHRHPDPAIVRPGPERFPVIPGFEVKSRVDHGAMGVVYRAIETGLDRPVALKILPGALGSDAGSHTRRHWLREARAVSSVRHPNIVPLYDYGEADGCFFLVLEYVPGGSLKQRLGEPLPPRAAAELMETIARAVGHVHGQGLFHLDLKPSNILLDGEVGAPWEAVTPRVADFGLAVSDGGHDVSETSLAGPRGTPSYMAPEQASAARAQIGAASDIHALGAILYELLTGRPPFQGASALETLDQVRGQNPVPLRRLNPKIPRDLETIALKCLEKNASRRYASAEALASDLRRWLDGRTISARPVSSIEHVWRWCRRRPAVAALAAALLMTFSVGFLTIVLLWRHAEVERNHAEQERSHAERERSHAEAGYQAARAALAEILDLGSQGLQTKGLSKDQLVVRLQTARRQILKLAEPRSNKLEIWKLLATVDLILGRDFDLQGKQVEARPLHAESLSYWEKILDEDPHDRTAIDHRWESLIRLARAVEHQGNVEDSIPHWERAILLGERMLPLLSEVQLGMFTECHLCLARLVDRLGDHDRAWTIVEENLRILVNLSAKRMTPAIRIWVDANRSELDQMELGRMIHGLPFRETDHLTAEDWADRVERRLSLTFGTDSMGSSKLSEFGYQCMRSLTGMASSERHTAKLDDARRTVDRIHALAHLMVARYPDQPNAHLSLCEAFVQRAKNAWQLDDRAAVERNWKLAIDEASQALRLNPQNARAGHLATDLQRRLNDLLAPLREIEAQGRSVRSALKTGL